MISTAKDLANGSPTSCTYKSVLLSLYMPTALHHWTHELKFSANRAYGIVGKIGIQFKKIINCWVTIAVVKVFTRQTSQRKK